MAKLSVGTPAPIVPMGACSSYLSVRHLAAVQVGKGGSLSSVAAVARGAGRSAWPTRAASPGQSGQASRLRTALHTTLPSHFCRCVFPFSLTYLRKVQKSQSRSEVGCTRLPFFARRGKRSRSGRDGVSAGLPALGTLANQLWMPSSSFCPSTVFTKVYVSRLVASPLMSS